MEVLPGETLTDGAISTFGCLLVPGGPKANEKRTPLHATYSDWRKYLPFKPHDTT